MRRVMNYRIELSPDKEYLKLTVFETINGAFEKEFAQKAIQEAKKHTIKKFLIDVRGISNIATTFEQYNLGYKDMTDFGLDPVSRIAILSDPENESHNFIETVFLNAGYKCRIFTDETDALDWL